MQVIINGQAREFAGDLSLGELVDKLGLTKEQVAVERNRVIVKRDSWPATPVADGDELEIVQFVGGG